MRAVCLLGAIALATASLWLANYGAERIMPWIIANEKWLTPAGTVFGVFCSLGGVVMQRYNASRHPPEPEAPPLFWRRAIFK